MFFTEWPGGRPAILESITSEVTYVKRGYSESQHHMQATGATTGATGPAIRSNEILIFNNIANFSRLGVGVYLFFFLFFFFKGENSF